MAFSLFGKKDEPATRKRPAAGAFEKPGDRAREPAPPPESAGRRRAAPTSGDLDLWLDFSYYSPPPPKAKSRASELARRPAAPVQKPEAASQAPAQKPPAVAPVPQVAASGAPAEAKAPATIPVTKLPASQETKPLAPASVSVPSVQEPFPDSIMNVEVTRGAAAATVIEEAAILFGNGQSLQALTALTKAVDDGNLGPFALQAWLMLFDLYRTLGMKGEFEALGMEFLTKFERSPPVWIEAEPQFNPALATGGTGYCALTGRLSDESASQLEKLRRMSQRLQAIRVDFARLQGVDPFGCARLLAVLEVLKTSGREIVFTGEAHLLRLLEAECQTKNRDTDGVLWSLLFEILRRLGLKDRFEEAAVNYAVTYELSPPSWESQAAAEPKPGPYVAAAEPPQPAFRLTGDVTGADGSLPEKLQDWARSNSPVVIDMSTVRRVDFVSAGRLLNEFTKLHQAGANIQIRGANELVAALFGVMGIEQVSRITRNR